MRVDQLNAPATGMYSLVYQNVQSSVGFRHPLEALLLGCLTGKHLGPIEAAHLSADERFGCVEHVVLDVVAIRPDGDLGVGGQERRCTRTTTGYRHRWDLLWEAAMHSRYGAPAPSAPVTANWEINQ